MRRPKKETNAAPTSRKYFAGVAGRWDRMRSGYFSEAIRDDAIASARLGAGAIVADVGTGTGFMIQGLAPLAAKAHGFDQSPEMLAVARKNLAAFANVELHEAPGDGLPVPDGSFDAAFANMYLHHAPDPPRAIAELARVLRPGGRLVITDLDAHDQEWMREEMADRWLGFRRDDIRAWYAAARLARIEVRCARGTCRGTSSQGREARLAIFLALGTKE